MTEPHEPEREGGSGTAAQEPRTLQPRVVTLWRVSAMLTAAVIALLPMVLRAMDLPIPFARWLSLGILTGGAAVAALHPPVRYLHWRYQFRDEDLFIQHGAVWRTASVVPYGRIQHVDTSQGPLERLFGLTSLTCFTAGHVGASLTIPGLLPDEAQALRDRLASLSGRDDAV